MELQNKKYFFFSTVRRFIINSNLLFHMCLNKLNLINKITTDYYLYNECHHGKSVHQTIIVVDTIKVHNKIIRRYSSKNKRELWTAFCFFYHHVQILIIYMFP